MLLITCEMSTQGNFLCLPAFPGQQEIYLAKGCLEIGKTEGKIPTVGVYQESSFSHNT